MKNFLLALVCLVSACNGQKTIETKVKEVVSLPSPAVVATATPNPWVNTFTPVRTLYVSPNAVGGYVADGANLSNLTMMKLNVPLSVDGKVVGSSGENGALEFLGNSYLQMAQSVATWGQSASVEAWVKGLPSTQTAAIIGSFSGVSSGGTGQQLEIQATTGKVALRISENATNGCDDSALILVGPVVADGSWHFVSAVIDQSLNVASLYVDGTLKGSGSISNIADSGCGIPGMSKIGGGTAFGASPTYLKAAIDELVVYKKALSLSEISSHYNSGLGQYTVASSDTASLFHLDDDTPGTQANPFSLFVAPPMAKPGDLYLLSAGLYDLNPILNSELILSVSGTDTNPIVYKALTPTTRATIDGAFALKGANIWVWGLEFTDLQHVNDDHPSSLSLYADGDHAINNYIHDTNMTDGIGAWETGAKQVTYGNIIHHQGKTNELHPHCIYTQNDFYASGYKYHIANILMDSADCAKGNCFNFHGYTEQGLISGMYLKNNISSRGRVIIGGFNKPADQEVVENNYFYNSSPTFGYRRPTQVSFQNNYMYKSNIDMQWFWGAGETLYTESAPSITKGNTIYQPTGSVANVRTSAYLVSGRCEGCPKLRDASTGDVWDYNTYLTPNFSASLFADNKSNSNVSFASWKSLTAAAGNAFDTNSTVSSVLPTEPKVVIIPNEYEVKRANLAVYNWGSKTSVAIDLSSVLPVGTNYKLYDAHDVFGTPVSQGTYYCGPITVPLNGEFTALVLIGE